MKDLPPLLHVPLLAEVLGLTEGGVRAMLRRRELPAARIGRRWVVRREALLRHIRQQEEASAALVRTQATAADRFIRGLPRIRG